MIARLDFTVLSDETIRVMEFEYDNSDAANRSLMIEQIVEEFGNDVIIKQSGPSDRQGKSLNDGLIIAHIRLSKFI